VIAKKYCKMGEYFWMNPVQSVAQTQLPQEEEEKKQIEPSEIQRPIQR
jgi:hypothetical protein